MKVLLVLMAVVCGSCTTPGEARRAVEGGGPPRWELRDEGHAFTLRHTQTGSCYVGVRAPVYGGWAVSLVPARSMGDCE
jgi:hypothetical protein